jgi:hypothetical protein
MAAQRPWPFGDAATCLARIIPGNQNLETPQVLSFRNGVTLRKKDGWHRITQKMYPVLAEKASDGGTPIIAFRPDPVARTVTDLRDEANARKAEEKRKKRKKKKKDKAAEVEAEPVHPALAAAQTDDPDEVAELAGAESFEDFEDEVAEPTRLSTAAFDADGGEEESPPPRRQPRGRRRVKLKKE